MSGKKKMKQAIKVLEERIDKDGIKWQLCQQGSGPKARKFWRRLGKAVKKGAKKLVEKKLISKGLAAAATIVPDPRLKLALGVSAKAAKALGAGSGKHGGAMVSGATYPTQISMGSGLRRAGSGKHGKGLKRAGGALRPAGSRPHRGNGAKSNPWLAHVAKFRAKHPGMSYKDALKAAKKTYKKK